MALVVHILGDGSMLSTCAAQGCSPLLPFSRCELAMSGTWDDGAGEGLCYSADGNAPSGRTLLLPFLLLHPPLLCSVVLSQCWGSMCLRSWSISSTHSRLEEKGQESSLLILHNIICVYVCLCVYRSITMI